METSSLIFFISFSEYTSIRSHFSILVSFAVSQERLPTITKTPGRSVLSRLPLPLNLLRIIHKRCLSSLQRT